MAELVIDQNKTKKKTLDEESKAQTKSSLTQEESMNLNNDSFSLEGSNQTNMKKKRRSKKLKKYYVMNNSTDPNFDNEAQYLNDPNEKPEEDRFRDKGEFSIRALVVGVIIGVLVCAMNVNFGLRTGWTQGGGVFTAIVSVGIFKVLNPVVPYTRWESVISITAASAAGTMTSAAGLVSCIPALKLLGRTFSIWQLYLWAFSISYFGVFFAILIRRQFIVVEKLRFPSGTAAAETVIAMFDKSAETVQKATTLIYWGIGSAIFTLVAYFFPFISEPPFPRFFRKWGFSLQIDPLLIGGGMLSGFRASFSLFCGTITGWAILGPIIKYYEWVSGPAISLNGVRGWILWVGVGIMLSDAIVQAAFSIQYTISFIIGIVKRYYTESMVRAGGMDPSKADWIRDKKESATQYVNIENAPQDLFDDEEEDHGNDNNEDDSEDSAKKRLKNDIKSIPVKDQASIVKMELNPISPQPIPLWWFSFIIIPCITTTIIGQTFFNIPWYFVAIAIPVSLFLATIATRSTGETDINPIGGMGKVTQLIFGVLAPGLIDTNLLAAGVVAAGASQCGDTMQDFKTGFVIKTSPKKQFFAQCIGVFFGILFAVPIYKLYDMSYNIGGEDVPAPAAQAWKSVAEVLAKGWFNLPKYSAWGMLGGLIFGTIIGFLYRFMLLTPIKMVQTLAPAVPSAIAFGIGFIVPPKQGVAMFSGAFCGQIWKILFPTMADRYFYSVACGLIAGEGLMGIFNALLKLCQIGPIFSFEEDLW